MLTPQRGPRPIGSLAGEICSWTSSRGSNDATASPFTSLLAQNQIRSPSLRQESSDRATYRDPSVRGYLIYFSASFLELPEERIDEAFGFFDPCQPNVLELSGEQLIRFRTHFDCLLRDQRRCSPANRRPILRHQHLTLLYRCRELLGDGAHADAPRTQTVSAAFRRYVEQHYLDTKTVKAYARLMNLSPAYLSEVVRRETGLPAKAIIDRRVRHEARNLLLHSRLSIAEIADVLGFEEATHFGRFFRRGEGVSPGRFRERARSTAAPVAR